MAPLIGITTRTLLQSTETRSDRLQALAETYVCAVSAAGGLPVLIPSSLGPERAIEIAGRLSGILLSGGPDVDPVHFGDEPRPGLGNIDPVRDEMEFALFRFATERKMPLLAVCRGMQLMNVALGGSLIQDLAHAGGGYLLHDLTSYSENTGHGIEIRPDTLLLSVVGRARILVNSYHHQAVAEPAAALVASARSSDGVIEALELPGHPFCLGVEWHPERSTANSPESTAIFRAFVEASCR